MLQHSPLANNLDIVVELLVVDVEALSLFHRAHVYISLVN